MRASARTKGRRWWGVGMASLALHALLGLLIFADLGRAPPRVSPPPAVEVWLAPELAAAKASVRPLSPTRRKAREQSVTRSDTVENLAPKASATLPTAAAAPSVVGPPAPLRGLAGCRLTTLDQLAPEARARCVERLASLERAQPPLNLDVTGRYADARTPYLARPPKNGCKPVAGVKEGVNGAFDAKIGIGCAFSF